MSEYKRRRRAEYNDYALEQDNTYIIPQEGNPIQHMAARDQVQVSGGYDTGYYVSEYPNDTSIQYGCRRFTDEQLDALNRTQLVIVLQDCYQIISRAAQVHGDLKKVNEKIESINRKCLDLLNGELRSKKIVIGVIAVLFFGLITKSGFIGLILGVSFTAIALFLDKQLFAQKRKEKAEEYAQRELPAAQDQKRQLEEEFSWISASDSWDNAQRLLPEDYLSLEAIEELTSLLKTRRARTLGEAIDAYENQLHRQRIEEMEKQKLQMAQAAAAAQTEAAQAQTRAAQAQTHAASVQEQSARRMAVGYQQQPQGQVAVKTTQTKGTVKCVYCKQPISVNASVCPYCRNQTAGMVGRFFTKITGM